MVSERALLGEIVQMEDLQEAWALLLHCAVPRANHTLRTVPPALCREYAKAHDDAVWSSCCELFAPDGVDVGADSLARAVASLPGAAGGLGLRESSLVALPAFIASRVASRPLVVEMVSHLESAGIVSTAQCLDAYDLRTGLLKSH